MDNFCSTRNTLAVGVGERLHNWRVHPYTAGNRNRCGVDQNHSGTKAFGLKVYKADTGEVRTKKI